MGDLAFRRPDGVDLSLLVGTAVAFAAVAALPIAPKALGDMNFHVEAMSIALGLKGAAPWADAYVTKAPGAVFYYVLPYLFVPSGSDTDAYWRAAVLFNASLLAISLLLLRRAGDAVFGGRAGILAAVFALASPLAVYYSYGVMAEPPAHFGAALLCWGWAAARSGPRPVGVVVGAPGLALVAMSRPNAVLLGLIMAAIAIVWTIRRAARVERDLLVAVAAAGVLFVGLVHGAGTLLPGQQLVASQGDNIAAVVLQGRYQYRNEPGDWRFWDDSTREGSADFADWEEKRAELHEVAEVTGRSFSGVQWEWIAADVVAHPLLSLRATAVKTVSMHIALANSKTPEAFALGPLVGPVGYWLFHAVFNSTNLALFGLSAVFMARRRGEVAALWPLWGLWLALVVFHALTYVEPRYLFPARPGLCLLAGAALDAMLPRRAPVTRATAG